MEKYSVRSGTIGGTLLSLSFGFDSSDLIRTAVLAAVGASVSFVVTWILKWVVERRKKEG
ncbi:MAG TPA: hypothetical protein VK183_13755 [Flavobacterium sp.]|nr:hypothetical protein [Flavobacterium sp.]